MPSDLTIGLIGLDTSHVPAFCKLLAEGKDVSGARVVAGYPGAVDDFEPSYSRVEKFTEQIRDEYGVKIEDSPQAVAERADLVFITSVDGRAHLGFMEKVAPVGKPVFLDKPVACNLEEASRIFELGKQHNIPVMSCSSLRYAEPLDNALSRDREGVQGIDTFGPMEVHNEQPGFYWYGVHQVEMLVAALGPGAARVQVDTSKHHDVATVEWSDGRVAVLHGQRYPHKRFGATLHREDGPEMLDLAQGSRTPYAAMLERIIQSLPTGTPAIPAEETLTVIAIIEAANQSRTNAGQAVDVPAVPQMIA